MRARACSVLMRVVILAHPACARAHKLYMRIREAVSNPSDKGGEGVVHQKIECYCSKHTPDHIEYSQEKRRYVHKESTLDISAAI